jgi:KaiC/GvpD/RAD55 family RecA-like ATPase
MIQDTGMRIPQEVYRFFSNPGGHSLILRGNAGAGKTTFALQTIEDLAAIEKSYYFPTRVSDESLFLQFPWLKEKMDLFLQVNGDKKNVPGKKWQPREGLCKLKGLTPSKPNSGMDHMSVSIGKDVSEIESLYKMVESRLPDRTLLVIDSLDALAERNGIPCVKLICAIQKDLVEQYGANVLCILESPEQLLDYLGDGVIRIGMMEHNGRRMREIEILKLRGCEIQQPKYLCTLKGGRLQSFGYWWERPIASEKPWRPVPDSGIRLSTGIKDLDGMISGGLEPGSVVLIELGTGVPISVAGALESSLVSNFASMNRGVIWVPLRKASAENVRARVTMNLPKETFDKCVRVGEHVSGMASSQYMIPLEGTDASSDFKWQTLTYHLQGTDTPSLSLMGFDTLESIYGNQVMEQLIDHMAMVRRNKSVFVGIVSPSSASTQRLIDLATVRLRVERIVGTVVLCGEEPYTELNAMQLKETEMGGGISLTPIV